MNQVEAQFVLKTRVKFYHKWVQDHDRRYERTLVLLVPEANAHYGAFLAEWMPDTWGEYFELATIIPSPIDSPCRMSIHRGTDEKSAQPYLTVMSKGVEDVIIRCKKEGDVLEVQVLGEDQDEVMDQMKDSDGSYDLIDGQTSF